MYNPEQVTYIGETDARNSNIRFGIKAKDRAQHMYAIGKTGMGKSTLLENMAIQDIKNGNGLAFLDPHGKTADLLLKYIPEERKDDVLYFAPFDMENPVSFNIMEDVGYDKRHLVVAGLMSSFKKIWQDAWSARMEYILTNTLFALLEYPGATLLSVNKMFADKKYRQKVVDNITDTSVKSFWVDEFAKYTERFAAEATPAIQNKVGQFTSNPLIRNIIGQPKSSFDLREIMDQKKIMIVNLSKGLVGEQNSALLGSLLVTKLYLAAMSRADASSDTLANLPNFYLFVDEFQSFANESFADILSEARKYKLNLTIAHQYVDQMPEEVASAVFGNVGTMVTFRVGANDAEYFEKEFAPVFTADDIVNLDKYQMYLRLMIDAVGSPPFSARGLAPFPEPENDVVADVIAASRRNFSRPRLEVEAEVKELVEMGREEALKKPYNEDNRPTNPWQKKKKKSGGGGPSGGGEMKPAIDDATKKELELFLRANGQHTSDLITEVKDGESAQADKKPGKVAEKGDKKDVQIKETEKPEKKHHKEDKKDQKESIVTQKQKVASPEHKADLKATLTAMLGDVAPENSENTSEQKSKQGESKKESKNASGAEHHNSQKHITLKKKSSHQQEKKHQRVPIDPEDVSAEDDQVNMRSGRIQRSVFAQDPLTQHQPHEIPEDELRKLLHVHHEQRDQ